MTRKVSNAVQNARSHSHGTIKGGIHTSPDWEKRSQTPGDLKRSRDTNVRASWSATSSRRLCTHTLQTREHWVLSRPGRECAHSRHHRQAHICSVAKPQALLTVQGARLSNAPGQRSCFTNKCLANDFLSSQNV